MNHKFRPDIDEYFIEMVKVVATRGSCVRRKVGCILVNKYNHVIATGYNGRHSGSTECFVDPCAGACADSGTSLDACEAIHAEQNALLQCKDTQEITVAYVTAFPCIHCIKLLLNTSCQRIVALEDYPGDSKRLWIKAGRQFEIRGTQ